MGYSFYSQLNRYHRLCNNKSDILIRAKLICQKLINHGYKFNLLWESFIRFINKCPVEIKYGVQRHGNLFLHMLFVDNYVVRYINSDAVYKIVAPCFVKIEKTSPTTPSQTEQTDRPPSPQISNTHTKWCDATPFPTGLGRESGDMPLWGV